MTDNLKFIDTNIFIYSYDSSEQEKHKIAKNILKKCWLKLETYAISTQIISEFYVNTTKKIQYPIEPEKVEEDIRDILSFENFKMFEIKRTTISKAINISIENKLSYWDSLIAATMQENGIYTIITENERDFKKISWLNIINPFKNQ